MEKKGVSEIKKKKLEEKNMTKAYHLLVCDEQRCFNE